MDRRSAVAHNVLSHVYWIQRRFQESLKSSAAARCFAPDWPAAYDNGVWVYAETGNREGFDDVFPGSSLPPLDRDLAWQAMSGSGVSDAVYELAGLFGEIHYARGLLYAMSGVADSALSSLHRSLDRHEDQVFLIYPLIRRMLDQPDAFEEVDRRIDVVSTAPHG